MATRNLGRQFGLQWGDLESLRPERGQNGRNPRPFHEMTPQEFEGRHQIQYHGTPYSSVPYQHSSLYAQDYGFPRTSPEGAGIHVGTLAAAKSRAATLGLNPEAGHGHIFPVVFTPENHRFGTRFRSFSTRDRGDDWRYGKYDAPQDDDPKREGQIEPYRNDAEDEGSVSYRVPEREMIQTQGDTIRDAVFEGKWVHPLMAALASDPHNDAFFARHPSSSIWSRPSSKVR